MAECSANEMTASAVHGYTVYEPEYYPRSYIYLSDAKYRYFRYLTDGYAATCRQGRRREEVDSGECFYPLGTDEDEY